MARCPYLPNSPAFNASHASLNSLLDWLMLIPESERTKCETDWFRLQRERFGVSENDINLFKEKLDAIRPPVETGTADREIISFGSPSGTGSPGGGPSIGPEPPPVNVGESLPGLLSDAVLEEAREAQAAAAAAAAEAAISLANALNVSVTAGGSSGGNVEDLEGEALVAAAAAAGAAASLRQASNNTTTAPTTPTTTTSQTVTSKHVQFLDLNLFSGSGEVFRTAVGAYWGIGSSSAEGEALEFGEGSLPFVGTASATTAGDYNLPTDQYFDSFKTNVSKQVATAVNTILPGYSVPVRVVGNPNIINDDKLWKTVLLGGNFAGKKHKVRYANGTFDDNSFEYQLPYSKKEAKLILGPRGEGPEVTKQIEISYDYNFYLKEYEEHIAGIDSELMIPNMYLFELFKEGAVTGEIDSTISDFVDLGTLSSNEVSAILSSSITEELPPYETKIDDWSGVAFLDKAKNIRNYLSSSYVKSAPKTTLLQLQNIIFDEGVYGITSTGTTNIIEEIETDKERFPFYAKISFPTDDKNNFGIAGTPLSLRELFVDSGYSQRFLKYLKEVFSGEIEDLNTSQIEFVNSQQYKSAIWDDKQFSVTDVKAATPAAYQAADLMEMIVHSHNNYTSATDNCYFLGGLTESRKAAFDTTGNSRYENTISALKVIDGVYGSFDSFGYRGLEELLATAGSSHVNNNGGFAGVETLAYRIEKIGGAPVNDSQKQETLQNFWYLNPATPNNEIRLYDSQIRYNRDYTYKVYAYVAVVGKKYEYSDLRISRQVGIDTNPTTGVTKNCLEFYDPITGKKKEPIYSETGTPIYDEEYLADFYVTYTPTIKIIEVPIYSKAFKTLDNPGSRPDISPYQIMNNSQKIGFAIDYEFFVQKEYPQPITEEDQRLKDEYEHARDFTPTEKVAEDSVSKPRFVEVYRLSEKPVSISDFGSNLISAIDLGIKNSKSTANVANFTDTIATNRKYYYLFRVLNEHKIPSHVSEIYEAELVDDGGYKYAVFNTLYEEDLKEDVFVNPSDAFKKLLHLKPSFSQLTLDTSGLDFTKKASEEIDKLVVGAADDLIWGKTFKVRLTSKKTGKKIDLNVTYNLENEV